MQYSYSKKMFTWKDQADPDSWRSG